MRPKTIEERLDEYRGKDLSSLSKVQEKYVSLVLSGLSIYETAKICGVSRQNVSATLQRAMERLDHPQADKHQIVDALLDGGDLSVLRPRERQAVEMRLLGMSYADIAREMGVSVQCVGMHLGNARNKLAGRPRYSEVYYSRDDVKAHRAEYHAAYYEANKERITRYSREYYCANREKLKEAERERRKKRNGRAFPGPSVR